MVGCVNGISAPVNKNRPEAEITVIQRICQEVIVFYSARDLSKCGMENEPGKSGKDRVLS